MSRPRHADLEVIVRRRDDATEGIIVLELAAVDGASLPPFAPGSHVDLLLPSGLVRQYSLAGDPAGGSWVIAVQAEDDGRAGAWVRSGVHEGTVLKLAGPRNHFEFEPADGSPVLFVAAGIGVTPLAPMAARALAAGIDFRFVYQGRSRDRMAFLTELVDAYGSRVEPRVTIEGSRLEIPALLDALTVDTIVYACGPGGFLDELETAAAQRGVELHLERFEAKLTEPVWPGPFEVELALTGVTVEVPPGRSILEVAEQAGAFVLSSCTEGTCGTCETPVLEGEVDHRDAILTPDERARNDVMYICVSRAACPRLVLDI